MRAVKLCTNKINWKRRLPGFQLLPCDVQGHSWNWAVIPESTGSCRRSAWSTFPPLCSDQSSAGTVLEAVYRRRPGLQDNVISAPSLSTFRQRLKHFCFRPRSLTLSLIPGKLFPTSSGSWSDFVTWTTLKIHDRLIDGSRPSGASSITCRLNSLLQDYLVLLSADRFSRLFAIQEHVVIYLHCFTGFNS